MTPEERPGTKSQPAKWSSWTSQSHEDNSNEESNCKARSHDPADKWRDIGRAVFHDSFLGSYAANFWVSLVFVLTGPVFTILFMNSKRAIVLATAGGLTILIWIIAIAACRRISESPPKSAANSTESSLQQETQEVHRNTIMSTGQSGGFSGINLGTVNIAPLKEKQDSKPTEWQPPPIPENYRAVFVQLGPFQVELPMEELTTGRWLLAPFNFTPTDGGMMWRPWPVRAEDMFVQVWCAVVDHRLFVKTTMPYDDGEVTITANAPDVQLPGKWDWNHNDRAVEIVDHARNPICQIVYERPDKLVIRGWFGRRGVFGAFLETNVIAEPLPFKVKPGLFKPLFRYPSGLHPGVLAQ